MTIRKIKMPIYKYVYKSVISQSDHAGFYDWFMRHNRKKHVKTSCTSYIHNKHFVMVWFVFLRRCGSLSTVKSHQVLWQLAGKGLWISIWDNEGERESIWNLRMWDGCPAVCHPSPLWPLLSEVNLGLIAEP